MLPCEACPINDLCDDGQIGHAREGYRQFNKGYITESELSMGSWSGVSQAIIDCGKMRRAEITDEAVCEFVNQ